MDKKPVILVVDDDSTLRFLAREALEDEFTVEEAGDGVAALEQARRLKPDLIMLDVQMPLMDGFEVCTRIRSDLDLMHVPILMATGLDDIASIETSYARGATNFIAKPIQWNTLPYDIRYLLRNSSLEEDLRAAKLRAEEQLAALTLEHTHRQRAEGELHVSEIRFRRLFETAADGILLLDFQTGRITDANATLTNMLGYRHSELLGQGLWDIGPVKDIPACRTALAELRSAEHFRLEQWPLTTRSGSGLVVEFVGTVYEVDDAKVIQCTFRDISERKQAEERIRYMALHDALTGLPNRALFNERLTHVIARARRNKQGVAVLMVDLDHFKRVNDSLGHHVGDALLEAAAVRLRSGLRENDIAARLGGDEFVIGLPDVTDAQGAGTVAQEILTILSAPYDIDGRELQLGASIGISLYPGDGADPGALLRAADTAMYEAKAKGRGTYRFFTSALNAAAQRSLTLANDLRNAFARGEFVVNYQPQVSARTGRIMGVEALLRWHHPVEGLISPVVFIPLLEESGLIVDVGRWVLRTACLQNAAWQAEGLPPIRMAVNLSARQFYRGDIVKTVEQALSESGLSPECLELELTESLTLDDTERTVQLMQDLKRLGVSLSLDDFGTGWSSLSYLRRFPIDRLKIDRSFMREVASHPSARAVVRSIMDLAQNLGLSCIAEGVETVEQLGYLQEQSCAEIQGFLYSPALPEAELGALLRSPRQLVIRPESAAVAGAANTPHPGAFAVSSTRTALPR